MHAVAGDCFRLGYGEGWEESGAEGEEGDCEGEGEGEDEVHGSLSVGCVVVSLGG